MDLSVRLTPKQLVEFAAYVQRLNSKLDFRVSSRGWGYMLEQEGVITKDQFDKVESAINRCRKAGLLPVDFVAEESARAFSGVENPTQESPAQHLRSWVDAALESDRYFTPDWWDGEEVYVQMVVEKVDLLELFGPICARYHIPIANAKGWSSVLQRAEYCRRFRRMERRGLRCVLMYCGDHDPDGLRISDTLRSNLEDVSRVRWADGSPGYDPADLEIIRFGLDKAFIDAHDLTWIDNLITGSGLDLSSPKHPNHALPYVQEYLRTVGVRKCEANAVVTVPEMGRAMCEAAILRILGDDAAERFDAKTEEATHLLNDVLDDSGAGKHLRAAIKALDKYDAR